MKGIVIVVLAIGAGGAGMFARQAPPAGAASRTLEGSWVRIDHAQSGSFGALASSFTPAVLTPQAQAAQAAGRGRGAAPQQLAPAYTQTTPNEAGQPYIVVERPCAGGGRGGFGGLLITPDSGGVNFVVHKNQVVMAGERNGSRYIFTDGRPHPDPARWVPQGAGHSIGRWEGHVLVAETVGFTPGNVVAGGMRSPKTKLTERFDVAPDGKSMTITYTWEDPEIYQKPHTYVLHFERPPGSPIYALEGWCDASDPVERQGIVPPPQIQ
jgi:hypothetical protein